MAHKFFVTSDDMTLNGFVIHTGSSRLGDPSLLTIQAPSSEFQLNPTQAANLMAVLGLYLDGDVMSIPGFEEIQNEGDEPKGVLSGIIEGLKGEENGS